MKSSKKIVTFSLAGVMALTVVGGTSLVAPKTASATTTIQFWNGWTGAETTTLNKAIASFEKTHKGIKVKSVPIPFDKLQPKLQTTLQSSTTKIDVFLGPHDWSGVFGTMKGGVLTDLNTLSTLKSALKDEKSSAVKAGKFKGKQIGFPESVECPVLIYNKDMIKKVPKTTDELIKMAKANTKGGKYGLVTDKTLYYYEREWFGALGGTEFKNDAGTKTGYGDKAFVNFLTFLKKLNDSKIMPKTCDMNTALALFNAKKAAFLIDGPWGFGDIDKSSMKGHWGIANLPSLNGKTAHPFMGVKMFYIPKAAKHKKEAAEFIKYMTSPSVQVMFNKAAGHIPANKKAKVSSWQTTAVLKQAEVAEPMPLVPQMAQVWTPVGDAITSVMGGTATPANAAKLANKKINEAIAKMQ